MVQFFGCGRRLDMLKGHPLARDLPAGRPKTASRRDPGGAAKARFYTPRSLRKRPSCLKSEARFPVGAVWHPAFAQVGGPPVRPRDFRAGKIKHEGRSRSERGVQKAVSTRGGGHVCLGAVFGQLPESGSRLREAASPAGSRSARRGKQTSLRRASCHPCTPRRRTSARRSPPSSRCPPFVLRLAGNPPSARRL